jgi:predicted PurR-regulated permease PerM
LPVDPFLPLIAWAVVIAIAYPAYRRLTTLLGNRQNLAAVLCTLLLLAVLAIPVGLLTKTTIEGIGTLAAHLKIGSISIAPPPASVETWPIVGPPKYRIWLAWVEGPAVVKQEV